MMMTDKELRRRFVMAVDEILPPAPALEARVRTELRHEQRLSRSLPGGSVFRDRFGLRFAAGLLAALVAATLVTAVLFGARPFGPAMPAHQPAPLASPPSGYEFTPTATNRSASWPAGGPIPAELAGCWQNLKHPSDPAFEVCLGQYSFDVGQGYALGNVVVSGSEVDFFSGVCGSNVGMPYDGYRFTITGSQLVLTSLARLVARGTGPVDPWSNCGWELDGSYSRVTSP